MLTIPGKGIGLIKGYARAQKIDKGRAPVPESPFNQVNQLLLVAGKGAGDKGRATDQGQRAGIESRGAAALGLDRGGNGGVRGGRRLPFGQAEHPVITGDNGDVKIAPQVVDKTIATFGKKAAVARSSAAAKILVTRAQLSG